MTSALCALCQQPISKGMPFMVVNTEVFHRQCVRDHGTHNSVGNIRHRQLVALEEENARMRYKLQEADRSANHAIEQDAKYRVAVATLQRDVEARTRGASSWERRYMEAREERDQALAERDAAQREAGLLSTLGRQAPTTPAQPQSTPQDTRDGTEIRFSLLELDKD